MVLFEPANFVRLVVVQIRKIGIDSRLTIRLFVFGEKRHRKSRRTSQFIMKILDFILLFNYNIA